jgi:ferric-dicitrate binding protein FerR (iron transport regulator)
MQDQDPKGPYYDLMTAYLSGNASPEEVLRLESFVASSAENKKLFMSMKKAWTWSGMTEPNVAFDVEMAWIETANQLFEQHQTIPIKSLKNRREWLTMAASIFFLAVASFLIYQMVHRSGDHYVRTAANREVVNLDDGSLVTLNHESSLRYMPDKKNNIRRVDLTGDAFFEVARDVARPFVIQTDQVEIEVLGTSFYVDARATESELQVIVEAGKVAVRKGQAEIIITAGEKAIYRKSDGQLIKQNNEDANFNALRTNTIVFNNSSMSEVAFVLNRQFSSKITLGNDELKSCELTSTFKDKSLNSIVEIIKSSLGIEARQSKNQVIFEGSCTLK